MELESLGSLALLTHRGGVEDTLPHPRRREVDSTRKSVTCRVESWGKPSQAQLSQEGSPEEELGSGRAAPPLPDPSLLELPVFGALTSPGWGWRLSGEARSRSFGVE